MRAIKKKIRVKKEDSAFVYFVLESQEGMTAYSTLDSLPESPYRDLLLMIPPDFEQDVNELLKDLGEMVYELKCES